MSLLPFRKPDAPGPALAPFLAGASIEVMPRTLAAIPDLRALLPTGTRVYIAHIDGTPIADMIAAARRLRDDGFAPMPHIPARLIAGRAELAEWIAMYRGEADVDQALLLGGGLSVPRGDFDNSMQMLETDLFAGFRRLHVAGHPEGSRDIDPDGSDRMVIKALHWKQAFAQRSDAQMAIVTQFCFDAAPVIAWTDRLAAEGIRLPIHIGVAGPAKLQTLLKFAISCGVGPSLRVLQRRARDVTRLMLPFEPDQILTDLSRSSAVGIEAVHLFPLGGIKTSADWLAARRNTLQNG